MGLTFSYENEVANQYSGLKRRTALEPLENSRLRGSIKQGQRVPQITVLKVLQGTSLVAQWLRIRLPMQGTRVRALVREDPTCHGATKSVRHNY